MLELREISQRYGRNLVLNQVSFHFKPNQIYGIIGPNGAGKSTLLRILAGFEKPLQGQVFLQGKNLLKPSPLISCMWQKPYLFQTTVFNNIAYGLKVRGVNKEKIRNLVREILEQFHLTHLEQKMAHHLSGGEAARVALARTVACASPVIVLDEPAANLDPPNTRLMEETLSKVQREKKLTIIIVTHDMFQARRLADYTLFLDRGSLKEAKETEKLFSDPEEESTQRFLQGLL